MDFTLTEEQKQILALIKQFGQKEFQTKQFTDLVQGVTSANSIAEVRSYKPQVHALLDKLHDVGLRQIGVPTQYGGGGADIVTQMLVSEAFGYWGGRPIIIALWLSGAGGGKQKGLTVSKKQEWIFEQFMANHHMLLGGSVSESASGVDVHYPYEQGGTVFAHKDGDEWVINGDKAFCSGGAMADLVVVQCRTKKDGPLSKSVSAFWVDPNTPGVSLNLNKVAGPQMLANGQFSYNNVRVPEENMIGKPNEYWDFHRALFSTKFTSYAPTLGELQRLYENMREYAKQRVCGGKPIIEHPNVGLQLGQCGIEIEMARAILYRAAWECEQRAQKGGPLNEAWGMASMVAIKNVAYNFGKTAAEIYGGMVGMRDMPIEGFIRWALSILPTGMPCGMQCIKFTEDYDTKYNFMVNG